MTRRHLVSLPRAEARHLAGTGTAWPASPEARCVAALREWLHGITRSRRATVPVSKIVNDLGLILALVPAASAPSRGPFGPGRAGRPLPGRVEYVGSGVVRLDETAISSLSGLPPGDDFRVTFTAVGPVLAVGADTYLACGEGSGTA